MGAPSRTVGLPIHLLYPIISAILLGVAAFPTASAVWYLSVQTNELAVRFAAQDYCGYNVTNLAVTSTIGCIYRGYEWSIPDRHFGFPLPDEVNISVSRVAIMTVVAFALVVASLFIHAYIIRYSFRKTPPPNTDKVWSLAQIHYVSTIVCFVFTWVTFIAVAVVVGRAVSFSNDPETLLPESERLGVGIYWGQSPWLILGSAIVHFGWVYEAVRWRVSLM